MGLGVVGHARRSSFLRSRQNISHTLRIPMANQVAAEVSSFGSIRIRQSGILAIIAIQPEPEGLIGWEGTRFAVGSLEYVKAMSRFGLTYVDYVYGYETSFLP